jgi:hypothetical protein
MNRTSRFARTGTPVRQGPADVVRALDPVTGLPVRLYRFAGDPVPGAEALDHPHVYRVLEAGSDDEGGFVVAHLVDGATDVASRGELLDDATAVAATAALASAARQGVAHGDMGAHRVHRRGHDVWLEGYGVPWSEADSADDAVRLAESLAATGGNALSPPVLQALEEAAESGTDAEPLARAVAAAAGRRTRRRESATIDDLYLQAGPDPDAERPAHEAAPAREEAGPVAIDGPREAERALHARRPPSDVPAPHADEPSPDERAPQASQAPRDEPAVPRGPSRGPPPAAPDAPAASQERRPAVPPWLRRQEAGPATPASGTIAGQTRTRQTGEPRAAGEPRARPTGGFSKQPPPDVSYRSGAMPEQPARAGTATGALPAAQRQRRRTWLLAALLVLALLLAIITAIARRPVPPPLEAGGPITSIVVDVRLEPATLPPASLVVVASPPGSRLAAGSEYGTVPRRVVFDAEGTWQIQGRFQGRLSEVATFMLPAERDVVLRFPTGP